jgi:dephospho-CoA kinase
MIIIGITGTLAAGKGTIVDYLVQKKEFAHFSVRSYLNTELAKRGIESNRDTLVALANELRATHSPSYLAEQLLDQAKQSGKNCIIESIRTLGEVEALKAKGNFTLFAIDADSRVRYDRAYSRASETDHVDFETFLENEKREMESTDPNKQNLSACIKRADYTLLNNGTEEELFTQIEQILGNM